MASFNEAMIEYKKQMEQGAVPKAYQGLMEYIMTLKTQLKNKYPDYVVSGSIYQGYMDMTYFAFLPKSLKERELKIAIVFIHATCRFEVWLGGYNKQIQAKYWKLFKESGWNQYHLVATTQGADSIVEHVLVETPDFDDLNALTQQIERETMQFIQAIESFLAQTPR